MIEGQGGDFARFRNTFDTFDLAFDARDALRFGATPEECGVERSVKMISIDQVAHRAG